MSAEKGERILVLGATNIPWELDDAALRYIHNDLLYERLNDVLCWLGDWLGFFFSQTFLIFRCFYFLDV